MDEITGASYVLRCECQVIPHEIRQGNDTTDKHSCASTIQSQATIADVDSAFFGWNDIWLDARFKSWSIEALLPAIRCPVLAIQGYDDEYGTMAQIDGIAAAQPGTRLLKLEQCGHAPQRDQPEQVIAATASLIAEARKSARLE